MSRLDQFALVDDAITVQPLSSSSKGSLDGEISRVYALDMPTSSRDDKRPASVTQEEFRKNSKQVVARAVRDGRIEITNAQGRVVAAVTAPRKDRPVTFD